MSTVAETTAAETAVTDETTPVAETAEATRHPLLDKEPTHLHRGYAVWLKDNVGYGPELPSDGETPSAEWENFVKVIQIAVVKYQDYQKSPENRARREQEAVEKAQAAEEAKAKREADKAAKAEAKAKADEEKAVAAAAKKAEGGDETDAPKAKKAPAKSGAKKPAVEAPF